MKNTFLWLVYAIFVTPFALGAMGQQATAQMVSAPTTNTAQGSSPPQAAEQNQSVIDKLKALFRAPPALHVPAEANTPSPSEQDQAAQLARDGQYDKALAILDRLHSQDPNNQSVTRDMVAILSWAGRNQDAVKLYETLPPNQPDYVLASVGHSYRSLSQTDKALAAYRLGLQQSPDNVLFAEGVVRCLVDQNKPDDALVVVNADIGKHGDRPEILAVKKDILQLIDQRDEQKAVELGRAKQYKESLAILSDLHARHGDDTRITQDYLCVMSWAGGNDAKVVALYKTLPAGDQPDYVLGVVGHSYRQLKQFADAQAIYEQGLQQHPDSDVFAEGVIRSLADQKKYNDALALANENLHTYGKRSKIVDIRKNILRLKKSHRRKT